MRNKFLRVLDMGSTLSGQLVKKHVSFRIVYFSMQFKVINQREKQVHFKVLCFNMYFTKKF